MTAYKNISEMTLAVEGARGPPISKKKKPFIYSLKRHYSKQHLKGQKMSQPATFNSGFKTPPLAFLLGRGPPEREKEDSFFC